jgi:hypothetical protein
VEAFLEFLESRLERADPAWFHAPDDDLIDATGFIHGQLAGDSHMRAVSKIEAFELGGLPRKKSTGDLGTRILQGEIDMAGILFSQVGHLSFDEHCADAFLKQRADLACQ